MVTLLIYLILLLAIFATLFYVVDMLPIPEPQFKQLAKIIIALVLLLVLVDVLTGSRILRLPPPY